MWIVWLVVALVVFTSVAVGAWVGTSVQRRRRRSNTRTLQAFVSHAKTEIPQSVALSWNKTCPCVCVLYDGCVEEFARSVTAAHVANPTLVVEGWVPPLGERETAAARTLAALHDRPGCFVRRPKQSPVGQTCARELAWAVLEETAHREVLLVAAGTRLLSDVGHLFECDEYLHNRLVAWLNGRLNPSVKSTASWSSDLLLVDRFHLGTVTRMVKHMCRQNPKLVGSAWPDSFDEWRAACEAQGHRFYEVPYFLGGDDGQVSHFAPFPGLEPKGEPVAVRRAKRT